jgi:multimeric flavodoxin WrbA
MSAADGIILGSPVYFSDISANLKAFIERAGYVSRANNYLFKHKAAAAVMAVRRGREIGEVENDSEGLANMRNLGENMTVLLNKLRRE